MGFPPGGPTLGIEVPSADLQMQDQHPVAHADREMIGPLVCVSAIPWEDAG